MSRTSTLSFQRCENCEYYSQYGPDIRYGVCGLDQQDLNPISMCFAFLPRRKRDTAWGRNVNGTTREQSLERLRDRMKHLSAHEHANLIREKEKCKTALKGPIAWTEL